MELIARFLNRRADRLPTGFAKWCARHPEPASWRWRCMGPITTGAGNTAGGGTRRLRFAPFKRERRGNRLYYLDIELS
jgi:hypothetical protein